MRRWRRYIPYVVYGAITLAVLLPLLMPGYILTLDLVFTPHLGIPSDIGSSYLLHVLFHVLNLALPGDIVEKMVLISILPLAGIGMHRLLRSLGRLEWACYPASIFYMINPFVYDRFMAGQYNVLLGYALLPWFVCSWFYFLQQPGWKTTLRLVAWTTVIGIVSLHTLGLLALVAGVGLLVRAFETRDKEYWLATGKWLAAWVALSVVASSYWLVPTLLGHGLIAESVRNFGTAQRQAFATVNTNGDGVLPAILSLQGFWADVQGLYLLPGEAVSQWWLAQSLVFVAVVIGASWSWRRELARAVLCSLLGLAAIVLALGVGADWLARWVPFFAGYREPQKFVALLALAYGFFIGGAAQWLLTARRRAVWVRAGLLFALCLLPFWFTPTMLWGFDAQLAPHAYPSDWMHANQLLNRDTNTGSVLFLPWHLYMSFDFAGRIIANPAQYFFDRPVIVSDDPEFNHAPPQINDPVKNKISLTLLPDLLHGKPVLSQLHQLGVRYVLVAKELDWQQYARALGSQPGIKLVFGSPTLRLYRL